MAPPTPPYVDVRTGFTNPPNMEVPRDGTFQWYNSNPLGGQSCSVTIAGNWCSTPNNPIAPQASAPSTVAGTTPDGSYNWSSPCCMSGQPVKVRGSHPFPPKKKAQ